MDLKEMDVKKFDSGELSPDDTIRQLQTAIQSMCRSEKQIYAEILRHAMAMDEFSLLKLLDYADDMTQIPYYRKSAKDEHTTKSNA